MLAVGRIPAPPFHNPKQRSGPRPTMSPPAASERQHQEKFTAVEILERSPPCPLGELAENHALLQPTKTACLRGPPPKNQGSACQERKYQNIRSKLTPNITQNYSPDEPKRTPRGSGQTAISPAAKLATMNPGGRRISAWVINHPAVKALILTTNAQGSYNTGARRRNRKHRAGHQSVATKAFLQPRAVHAPISICFRNWCRWFLARVGRDFENR